MKALLLAVLLFATLAKADGIASLDFSNNHDGYISQSFHPPTFLVQNVPNVLEQNGTYDIFTGWSDGLVFEWTMEAGHSGEILWAHCTQWEQPLAQILQLCGDYSLSGDWAIAFGAQPLTVVNGTGVFVPGQYVSSYGAVLTISPMQAIETPEPGVLELLDIAGMAMVGLLLLYLWAERRSTKSNKELL